MRNIKKITSLLLVICLIATSVGFQSVTAEALQSDSTSIERVATPEGSIPFVTESNDLTTSLLKSEDKVESQSDDSSIPRIKNSDSLYKNLEEKKEPNEEFLAIEENELEQNKVSSDKDNSLITDLNESDEESPRLNKAFINGNILTLNFDEKLNNEKIPSTNDFKVRITYNQQSTEKDTGLVDPVYTTSLDPVYKSSTDTTVYPVLAGNTKINEISIFDNKVVLTLADAVTSSSAVSLGYTSAGGDNLLCDQTGNAVESFSDYGVANYTGGSGIPDFVAEELYNELDTSLLSEKLAPQVYYAMTECKGSRTEILAIAKEVVSVLSDSNATYKGFTDENKLKLCKFFEISDAFFNYSEGKGENVEQTIIVYSKMAGLGLTEEEIEQSVQNNTRDQVISEKEQGGLISSNRRSLLSTASGEEDPFADVKYDKQKTLSAPFKHNDGANEQINLGSGALDYNVTDVILPGVGGLDLKIERQYSTEQANYYDIYGRLQYGTTSKGQPLYSRMNVYEREKHFQKNADGTIGGTIEKTSEHLKSEDFIGSYEFRGFYNQKEIEDKGNYYAAHLHRHAMTTDTTNNMAAKQTTIPVTKNDELWKLGTGWKFNFSYIEKDTFYYDFMKLHLSDGRDLAISPNWINNLGHYTYKDVIFTNESKEIRGQVSSHSVTYADGKKEYFNGDGRLIAIVDRFGNTISFVHTDVKTMSHNIYVNCVDITITDTLGQITTIKTDANRCADDRILTLPDGKTMIYKLSRNDARVLNSMRQYEKFPTDFNEYNLSSVINQVGEVTTYDYTDIECPAGFAARFKLTDKRKFMSPDPFDDGDKYYPNYYAGLSKITYPTGMSVNYEYYPRINNWYDFGCIMDIAIKKRYDQQGSVKNNEKEYVYSYQYKKNGELRDLLYSADGYNNTFREGREFDDWADYCIKEKDINRNTTKEYYFDPRNGICTQEKVYLGSDLVQSITNEYRKYNLFYYQSKTRVATVRYDTSDKQPLRTIECYAYDDRGNAISYWTPLAEGNTSDNEYKVSMTYDDQYSYLIGKTYKRDAATTISEQNVPSADKKTIVQSLIYENGILKSKSDFAYDTYGNPVMNKKYTDVAADTFIETDYTYKDGTYLTGITVQNVKDADGKNLGSISRHATRDIYGKITSETDANGNITIYTYDNIGRITGIHYPNDLYIYYYYKVGLKDNEIEVARSSDFRSFLYKYDPAGNLTYIYRVDDPIGGYKTLMNVYEYDSLNRLVKEQNNLSEKRGGTNIYEYDYQDHITKKCSVDSASQIVLSQENYKYYDDKITREIEGDDNSSSIMTSDYMDKYGRVIKNGQIIDGTEVFNTFVYDYIGEMVKEKSARANAENYPEEYTTKNEYDHAGNVIKQYDVFGNYITTSYDAVGRKISETDARSNEKGGTYKTIYAYDDLGRLVREETPIDSNLTAETKYYYDDNGNLIQKKTKTEGQEIRYKKVDYEYNNMNELKKVTNYKVDSIANQVEYEYNGPGNITVMKTANGEHITKYGYGRYGELVMLTDPMNQVESYSEDYKGNRIFTKDRNGDATEYIYDGLGRKTGQRVTTSKGIENLETIGYTKTGQIAFAQNETKLKNPIYDKQGRVIIEDETFRTDYAYNGQGRVIRETDSNGTQNEYTYDANGNIKTSIVKVNGVPKKEMSFVYDKKDRLIQVYEAGNLLAAYTYDVNGNRSSLNYGNGNSVKYTYNLSNLLTSIKNIGKDGYTISDYTYEYLLDGNISKVNLNGKMFVEYDYDDLGRPVLEFRGDGSSKVYNKYDSESNCTSIRVGGQVRGKSKYKYDANNRLITAYRKDGNILETTDYSYDCNGNTIGETTTVSDQKGEKQTTETNFCYDGFNRLRNSSNKDISITYAYKPSGLRISKTVNSVQTGVKKTKYVLEGQDIALELDANNNVNDRYLRGIGLICSDKNGWYLHNGHGDVVHLTNNEGKPTAFYEYDTFGNELSYKDDSNPFRYCGEYFDKETGDIYLRARYYNPSIGRFISEDSVRGDINDPLSLNLYTYCKNNPILYKDPSGNQYIIDDMWHGMVYRADVMRENPNAYNVGNWLSMGFVDTVNGAVNPEKPLSMQHWIDSAAVVTTFAGGYGAYKNAVPKTSMATTAGKTALKGGSKVIFKSTDDAANLVAKNLDGTLSELKNGYKIEIPNGNKPIVVRIMNEGSGGRSNPYFRVSVDGKGSLTLGGKLSNERGLTHIDMTDNFLNQITEMIKKYQGK